MAKPRISFISFMFVFAIFAREVQEMTEQVYQSAGLNTGEHKISPKNHSEAIEALIRGLVRIKGHQKSILIRGSSAPLRGDLIDG